MTTIVLHLEPWSMFLILLRNLPAVFIFIQFILLVCIHCWVDTHIRAWLLSNSFWENIILARDLEVLKSIYLFRLTFQTNTVRHQNITKLKCQDVKLDQLSRCQNEKVRVKTANKDCTTNKCWGEKGEKCWGEKGGKDNVGLQIPGSKSWTHKCKSNLSA